MTESHTPESLRELARKIAFESSALTRSYAHSVPADVASYGVSPAAASYNAAWEAFREACTPALLIALVDRLEHYASNQASWDANEQHPPDDCRDDVMTTPLLPR